MGYCSGQSGYGQCGYEIWAFDWIQIGLVLWSDFSSVLKISVIHVLLLSHTKKEFLVIIFWISQDLDPSGFEIIKIGIAHDSDFSSIFQGHSVMGHPIMGFSSYTVFLDAQDSK
jgi:hypothetical protein